MQDLEKWILEEDKPYKEGVQLYNKYGKNRILKHRFEIGTAYKMKETLTYELTKIAKDNGIEKQIVILVPGEFTPAPTISVQDTIKKYATSKKAVVKDSEVAQLIAACEKEMNEFRIARAKLSNNYHNLTKVEELAANHARIEEVMEQYKKVSDNKFSLETYGKLPSHNVVPEQSSNIGELKNKKRRLQDKKTKLRGKLKKILPNDEKGDIKRVKWETELVQTEAEIADVIERIKSIEHYEETK